MIGEQIIEFDCPYKTCVWPHCQTSTQGSAAHPACASEIERAQREVVRKLAIRPRTKR